MYSTLTPKTVYKCFLRKGVTAPAALHRLQEKDETDDGIDDSRWEAGSDSEGVGSESEGSGDEGVDEVDAQADARHDCEGCKHLRDVAMPRQLPENVKAGVNTSQDDDTGSIHCLLLTSYIPFSSSS